MGTGQNIHGVRFDPKEKGIGEAPQQRAPQSRMTKRKRPGIFSKTEDQFIDFCEETRSQPFHLLIIPASGRIHFCPRLWQYKDA